MVAAQAIAYQLASDTYDLLEAYPTEATRYGYDLRKTAAENKVALKTKFDSQANLMVAKYNNTVQNSDGTRGLYNSFDGLSAALLSSIGAAANCNGNESALNAPAPSLLGWVKESRGEYLITNCKNLNTPVVARYYLKVDSSSVNSDSVVNVMGVLIPGYEMLAPIGTPVNSRSDAAGSGFSRIFLKLQAAPVPYTFAVNSVNQTPYPRWLSDQLGGVGNDALLARNAGDKRDTTLT